MQFKFSYNFVRIAPRKIRLVTNLVKNMSPEDALNQLKFLQKDAALPVYEILKSAVASCKNEGVDLKDLKIVSFTCDEGPSIKRRRFKSRGRAHQIKKRSSHINLVIESIDKKSSVKKASVKKTEVKKTKTIVAPSDKKDK